MNDAVGCHSRLAIGGVVIGLGLRRFAGGAVAVEVDEDHNVDGGELGSDQFARCNGFEGSRGAGAGPVPDLRPKIVTSGKEQVLISKGLKSRNII